MTGQQDSITQQEASDRLWLMRMQFPSTRRPSDRVTFGIVAGLFLASGASALIYEIVWTRLFSYTFGASAIALSVVLAAFMGGLALGGAIGSCVADRLRRPLLAYAFCEFSIVLCALLLPEVIRAGEVIERFFYHQSAHPGWIVTVMRFGWAFLSLVVPTALMGATLPILSRFAVSKTGHLGRRVGGLSAANTAGAVVGVCLAGFLLLPELGISRTVSIGVVVNLVAAFGAILLDRAGGGRPAGRDSGFEDSASDGITTLESDRSPRKDWSGSAVVVVVALFLSGMMALAAEYLWTRSLLFSFDRLKNTTYSFTCVLAVFLTGFALGSAIAARLVDTVRDPHRWLGGLLLLLGAAITISAGVVYWGSPHQDMVNPVTLRLDMPHALLGMLRRTVLVVGPPTLLMGTIFPFAVRSLSTSGDVGRWVGRLYASNTLGAVLGSLVAAYLIIPWVGIGRGIVLAGLVEMLVGLFILRPRYLMYPALAAVVGAIAGVVGMSPQAWSLQTLNDGDRLVGYRESPTATVAVIEDPLGNRRICIDDVAVAGTSRIMQTDQKGLAHLPMLLQRNPEKALTVGFGSGGASYSFLLHDSAQQVDCAEICPAVVEFAPLLEDANHRFLDRNDPRYRVIFEDARNYLKYTDEVYDVIVTDCTDLRYRASANLYDYEFFQLCREHTTAEGLTVVWMPLGGLSREMFRLTLRTFLQVYPETNVFYLHNEWTHFVLLVGSRDQLSIDFATLKQRSREPDVREDLAAIGFDDPAKFVATYVTGGRRLAAFVGEGEINTEQRPILEFQVPRHETGPWSAQQNLNGLRRHRQSVLPLLTAATTSEDASRIERYQRAAVHIIDAQEAERRFDIDAATRGYLLALRITPDDPAIAASLEFPRLQDLAERGNPTARLFLGRAAQLQGRHADALSHFAGYHERTAALRDAPADGAQGMLKQADAWNVTAQQWQSLSELEIGRNPAADSDGGRER